MRSWLASLALLVLACGEPAGSIVIVIDTDLAMPAELDAVVLRRFDASGALVDERAVAVRSPVELAPVARADEPLHVVALGRVAGRPIVDTEARTRFVPGARLRLDLFLARECVDARCPSTLTCGAGGCRDVFVDPEALPPWQDLDAGRARDATITRDATRPRDATLDARTPPPDARAPDAAREDGGAGPDAALLVDAGDAAFFDLDAGPEVDCRDDPCPPGVTCFDGPLGGDRCLCPSGTVSIDGGCAVPRCTGARLCRGPSSDPVRRREAYTFGGNVRLSVAHDDPAGVIVGYASTQCCVAPPLAGSTGVARMGEPPVVVEARASADANSYWASLGASAGAMWLLDAFSTYASAHPIDPATIASAAPTSVELTGTLLAPPQLAPVPGGWAALVLEAAGPSLRAFAPDLTRVGTDLVLASGSVRVPRLTPTCGGNLLATWSTTTHSFAAPIGPALHALAPPVPTPVPARSGPYQQAAAFDGQHVLVPTSDGFAAFEADGAPAYQQPFPDVSSAFGTDDGVVVLQHYAEGRPVRIVLVDPSTGAELRELAQVPEAGTDGREVAVALHTAATGERSLVFLLTSFARRGWIMAVELACR